MNREFPKRECRPLSFRLWGRMEARCSWSPEFTREHWGAGQGSGAGRDPTVAVPSWPGARGRQKHYYPTSAGAVGSVWLPGDSGSGMQFSLSSGCFWPAYPSPQGPLLAGSRCWKEESVPHNCCPLLSLAPWTASPCSLGRSISGAPPVPILAGNSNGSCGRGVCPHHYTPKIHPCPFTIVLTVGGLCCKSRVWLECKQP